MARALLTIAAVLAVATAAGAVSPVNKSFLARTAVKGYDVVAYFEAGAPREGKSDFTHDWQGATWRFATAANRDAFAADPERYAPQYGGYCAYAVAKGATADVDPEAWKIVDGKLYLNLSKSIQARWEKDVPGYIARADANWPGLVDE